MIRDSFGSNGYCRCLRRQSRQRRRRLGRGVDTAAIVKNLDLVITCDTALAHLAGGLGAPVWTLLPKSSDWRWLADRDDSPWYPTMRLFRQSRLGDWSDVVHRVTRELAGVVNQRK